MQPYRILKRALNKSNFNWNIRKRYAASEHRSVQTYANCIIWYVEHFQICDDLTREKEHFRENARKEMQGEIELLRKEQDAEIQQIHKRVQHAIDRKQSSIVALQDENTALRDRCGKLEAIIRQQRKDYCTK